MVTVDPERDTPERLAAYFDSKGDEPFIGLTGPRENLESIWRDYSVAVQREEAPQEGAGYWVAHSASTYLIDPRGRLLANYAFGTPAKDMATDLRRRMRGG